MNFGGMFRKESRRDGSTFTCSREALSSAAQMSQYFLTQATTISFFFDGSVGKALSETCDFFDESRHEEGRPLFSLIVESSCDDVGVPLTAADPESFGRVYERIQEYLLRQDVALSHYRRPSFENAVIQLAIGDMYRQGDDRIRKNPTKAIEWLRKSASQNQPEHQRAMLRLNELESGIVTVTV
jgi:Sel1 repeat